MWPRELGSLYQRFSSLLGDEAGQFRNQQSRTVVKFGDHSSIWDSWPIAFSGHPRGPKIAHPSDEGLYILEGQCTFNAGGKTFKAGPGTFVSIPRLVEHSFTVDVPNSRLLNWYSPGGFEMLLMSIATPAAERKPPVPNSLPMPPRWMVEECAREFGQITVHGLPFADPPTKENMATRPSEVNPVKPYGVEVKNAPAYWSQGILWTILPTADQTGGSYSLIED
jgi:Cupin domain